ncbi:MAG: hypothetical protein U5K70_00610 [Halodesulfurarchaeum sp.]|nr:hypothetical protein [Halodesulfurarchaeum sp.]
MASGPDWLNRHTLLRVVGPILGSTIVLTATFLGALALLVGGVEGFSTRFPYYVLIMALGFVGALFVLERPRIEGSQVLMATIGVTVTVFVVVTLAGEGLAYAVSYPAAVFQPDFILYLLAAGLIGSGLAYWTISHWREFTR